MSKKHSYQLVIIIFTFLIALGFTTNAAAQDDVTTPNPGDPIIVDGDISDWDLSADFYEEMFRHNDPTVHEANVYLRFNYDISTDTGRLSILVITTAGSSNIPAEGWATTVFLDDVQANPPGYEEAFVNVQSGYADGWEASFPVSLDQHILFLRTSIEHDEIIYFAKLPIETPVIDIYRWDYGDLPDSYGTYELSNGPRHSASTLRLGPQVDGESDGQPGTNPVQDDLNGRNDEDGVEPVGNWLSSSPTISYTVNGCSGVCYLNMWIDWDGDSNFDELYDEVFTDTLVSIGTYYQTFSRPSHITGPFPSNLNIRVRLCDTLGGCATPHALGSDDAPFGEVEDYQWSFQPNAVTINSFSATPSQNSIVMYILAGSVLALLILGAATFIQKRKNL